MSAKSLFVGLAVLSLTGCQTLGGGGSLPSPDALLLEGIDVPVVAENMPIPQLSTSDATCLKFYANTASFASIPTAELDLDMPDMPGMPGVPEKPSFGSSLVKTLVLGTISGVVGGGVSSLGIGSNFVESALIGTATQVTYNTGDTVYDSILGDKTPDLSTPEGQAAAAAAASAHDVTSHTHGVNGEVIVAAAPAASAAGDAAAATPMGAIEAAAKQLGCPAPDASAIAALKLDEKLN